jgi:hypothetical protein
MPNSMLTTKGLAGRSLFRTALGALALCCFALTGYAQSEGQTIPHRGFQPTDSYALGNIETINTTSGNLMLNIPLASLPAGRSGSPGYWVGLLEQPTQPWTRIQARTAFADSGEFGAIVSTVYGINNGEISGRVARYVANMYLAVPAGSGSQTNDTATLETAAAEGQSQAVQAARTIGINLFQPWLTGPQTNLEFVTGLFNAFLQREPSTTEGTPG